MNLIIHPDLETTAKAAASILAREIERRPDLRVGLAAGRTFAPVYRAFEAEVRRTSLAVHQVVWIQLDEYVGLNDKDPRAFRFQLEQEVLDPLQITPAQRLMLAQTDAPGVEIVRHASAIAAAGGVDLQLLGLGANGHLAFNEPGSNHSASARVVDLAKETCRQAEPIFSPSAPPQRGMTLGLKEIRAARAVLLVATGETKATALAAALDPAGDPLRPISALQDHPAFTVLADAAAARLLAVAEGAMS